MTDSLPAGNPSTPPADRPARVVTRDERVGAVLDALDDAACRAILEATSDGPLPAKGVSEATGVPLSTTYRKLARLAELDLLDERIQIRGSGKHTVHFTLTIERAVVEFDQEGNVILRLERTDGVDEQPAQDPTTMG